ncbi:hypothetical protein V8J82_06340 [Gymnodinialimonas sp. 2305UL16-5]|uniref:hypothetical protein n=1 Tax=Gymnodinialimonas mytili TaxID=3126503 RepID=UPI0030997EA8
MPTPCLSLHRIAYDPVALAFLAEAQFLDTTGVRRRRITWRGPVTAEFQRIASGLRDAALSAA